MNIFHAPRPAMAASHVRLGMFFFSLLIALRAFAVSQVNLAWDPSPSTSVVGYNIYYGQASGSYSSKLSVGNQTSSTVPGLTEGKTYYFVITARDSTGKESARSNETSYAVPSSTTAPLASFTASPSSGTAPLTVTFSGSGTGTISGYSWDFGDGSTSTQQNLTHSYANPGSYAVALTVTGPGGTNTTRQTISVASSTGTTTTATCPCSLWAATTAPGVANAPDYAAVTVGVKFRSNRNGYITGIRFYKGTSNTGTHIGTLWTGSGQKLAEATFTNETASGWQQVNFSAPVPITANTIYVASYHTDVGRYADDENYFATTGIAKSPLEALRDAVSGPNGVYRYGSTVSFPSAGWRASNYWVDVVFR